VQTGAHTRQQTLSVGVAEGLPKLIVQKLLEPALQMPSAAHIVCREDHPDRLVSRLALYELDVVLSDVPVGPSLHIRAYNHLLGECGTSFFATAALARKYAKNFPASLVDAPVLLPTENTALRRSLDHWFAARGLEPRVIGEFEDSALLKAFGHAGAGIFPGPTVIEKEIARQYQVRVIGNVPEIRERYYAISVERRLRHPAVVAIGDRARHQFFA
jgi:LysR family transcriptional activator of nhaA